MPEEVGTVVWVEGAKARVRIERQQACAGCHACLASEDGRYMIAEADDPLGSSEGDLVQMESAEGGRIKAGFILFILPLLLFLAGFLVGEALGKSLGEGSHRQSLGLLLGFTFLALPYGILYLKTRLRKRRNSNQGNSDRRDPYQLKIIKILKRST